MARPVTREVKLKTGFYIEVRRRGENRGIKIWHEQSVWFVGELIKGYYLCRSE